MLWVPRNASTAGVFGLGLGLGLGLMCLSVLRLFEFEFELLLCHSVLDKQEIQVEWSV